MIRVPVRTVPASLDGPTSAGALEAAAAIAFYDNDANPDEPFDFKAYKGADVNAALSTEFRGKCAYCESPYEATHPVDVEHYRPKGGVVRNDSLKKPGYYWLAADWMNLLPSCIDCNRRRRQKFLDEPVHLAGKANLFPIANESRRATGPGKEASERRLLLHPRLDDPRQHLEFFGEGEVRERLTRAGRPSPKATASIKVYGLRRKGLMDARKARFLLLNGSIAKIGLMRDGLLQSPGNAPFQQALDIEISLLETMTKADAPYTAMARQIAGPVLRSLGR